jgi:hypothetical protein
MPDDRFSARSRWLTALLVATLLLDCGCTKYPDVSPATYDYAKAIYSITNRQAENQLPALTEQIETSLESGELSQQEARWLSDIIDDASRDQWGKASRAARQIMEDQLKQADAVERGT